MAVITVSGPSGGGKSTVAKYLAKKLKLRYYSAGSFFRMKAEKEGVSIEEFMKKATKKLHNEADNYSKLVAKKGNVVIDSRLAGYLVKNADFRIYITAPVRTRAERISGREKVNARKALRDMVLRDRHDAKVYKRIYGIDTSDLGVYDLVLNTEFFKIPQTRKICENAVKTALKNGL